MAKFNLKKEDSIMALSIAFALIILGAYLSIYAPMIKELKGRELVCKEVENDVIEARNIIASAGITYEKRVLMSEGDVSQSIDEMARRGKAEGVNFISMSPDEIRFDKGSQYSILPIDMETKSTYQQLGVFLGALDDMEKGIIKVAGFDISGDEDDPSIVTTDLSINMYISARDNDQVVEW